MAGDSVKCVPTKTKSCSANDIPLCTDVLKEELGYFEGKFFGMQELAVVKDEKGKEEFTTFLPASSYAEADMPDPRGEPGVRTLKDRDNPKTPANENELDEVVYSGYLDLNKLDGICRLSHKTDAGKEWNKYYAYTGRLGHMLFSNEDASNDIDDSDIDLPVGEMKVIIPALGLGPTDVAVKAGSNPYAKEEGGPVMNTFHFSGQYNRLEQIIDRLNKVKGVLTAQGSGVSAATVDQLSAHLGKIYDVYKTQLDSSKRQLDLIEKQLADKDSDFWKMFASQAILQAIFTTPMLIIFYKNLKMSQQSIEMQKVTTDMMRKQIEGDSDTNKFERFSDDFVKMQRDRLSQDILANEIRGRDKEAVQLLVELADMDSSNPRLTGASGVGKDKIAERAAQLIALRDPRVPRQFYDGTIKGFWKIDYNKFTAQSGIVGGGGQRLRAIEGKMREGYAVYLSEIADVMTMGSHSGGNAESFAAGMKGALTQPYSKFASSTTPASWDAIVRQNPQIGDHERRFPAIEVSDLSVDTLRKIFYDVRIPALQAYHKVKILPDAREAAINLALLTMSDQSKARFDAIDIVLKRAIRDAVMERGGLSSAVVEITKERIAGVISEQQQISIDPDAKFVDTVVVDGYDDGKYFGDTLMQEMAKDKWFAKLENGERREAVRIAGSLLLDEGGSRFRSADGTIKVSDLAREAKAGMSAPAPAAVAAAPAPAPAVPVPLESDMNDPRQCEVEIMRKTLLREAREWPKDGSVIPFNIETYTETDQRNFATMAYTEFEGMKKDESKWSKYLEIKDNAGVFKPGAAHKLLAQGMKRESHPSRGLVNGLCKGLDKMQDERAKAEKKVARDAAKEAARRGK